MEPKRSIDYKEEVRRQRQRSRNMSRHYFLSSPSLTNMYNAVKNLLNSLPVVGIQEMDVNPNMYTGVAPTPGKPVRAFRPLSPQQIKTLRPYDRNLYNRTINRITEQDAQRELLKQKAEDLRGYRFQPSWKDEADYFEYQQAAKRNALNRRIAENTKGMDAEDAALVEQHILRTDPDYVKFMNSERGAVPPEIYKTGYSFEDEYWWDRYGGTDYGLWRLNNYNRALRGLPPAEF